MIPGALESCGASSKTGHRRMNRNPRTPRRAAWCCAPMACPNAGRIPKSASRDRANPRPRKPSRVRAQAGHHARRRLDRRRILHLPPQDAGPPDDRDSGRVAARHHPENRVSPRPCTGPARTARASSAPSAGSSRCWATKSSPSKSPACTPATNQRPPQLGAHGIPVTIENYEQTLRDNFVILSAEERRKKIEDEIAA
jgi:hypothetical protein